MQCNEKKQRESLKQTFSLLLRHAYCFLELDIFVLNDLVLTASLALMTFLHKKC